MLGLTRSILPRLAAPLSAQLTSVRQYKPNLYRHESDVYRFSPKPPNDKYHVGAWPRTKEEREQAAKKYNLIPEDYEPFPEEEGFGDYPNLKAIGDYNRDNYDDYDDIYSYRFYGEPYHIDANQYEWYRWDPLLDEKPQYLPSYPVRILVVAVLPVLLGYGYLYMQDNDIAFNPPYKHYSVLKGKAYTFPDSPIDGTAPHGSSHH